MVELKEYYSRAELQRRLKQLQGFSTRGAEDVIELKSGAKITKYEYNVIKAETTRAKRQVSKQINFYEKTKVKIAGKEQSTTFARTGDDDYLKRCIKWRIEHEPGKSACQTGCDYGFYDAALCAVKRDSVHRL